jgi:hypothetical protein
LLIFPFPLSLPLSPLLIGPRSLFSIHNLHKQTILFTFSRVDTFTKSTCFVQILLVSNAVERELFQGYCIVNVLSTGSALSHACTSCPHLFSLLAAYSLDGKTMLGCFHCNPVRHMQ